MKVKRLRQTIILACEETAERIYLTSKNKRNTPERLVLKKYSPKLRRRVIFKEVK
ncbi:50S ribosomal protein L33 [Enterococcus sp. DIV0660C]|uniref:50S ribosomal protein L33 n=1 Tax=Enterococcus sp. DIV0660C TaxID=2230880 RepID=UPI002413E6EB|nr:50S ribosomal protein L33 [Enterococcus sp. DIV0660C]